jgi:hypothetical protein
MADGFARLRNAPLLSWHTVLGIRYPMRGHARAHPRKSGSRPFAKSLCLTDFAVVRWAANQPLRIQLTVRRTAAGLQRGGVTLLHPAIREVTPPSGSRLSPDFHFQDGLRIGLSPLSTSFAGSKSGWRNVREILRDLPA